MVYFRARIAGWSNEELLAQLRRYHSDTLLSPGGLARVLDELWFACIERGLQDRAQAVINEVKEAERQRQREQRDRIQKLGQRERELH